MIFSTKQEIAINNIVNALLLQNENVEWTLKEEDRKYMNTIDESLVIAIGHGKLTHLDNLDYLEESYNYYSNKKQLDYVINIFRYNQDKLRYVVYKCNNGELNGSTKISSGMLEF